MRHSGRSEAEIRNHSTPACLMGTPAFAGVTVIKRVMAIMGKIAVIEEGSDGNPSRKNEYVAISPPASFYP